MCIRDRLYKYKINHWQFLPLTPTDSTGSPYSSPSSFALNPWFLDINKLIEENFIISLNKKDLQSSNQNEDHFDFDFANNLSKKLGEYLLFDWESQSEERKTDFYLWNKKNTWVEDYSMFMVIREEFNMLPWWEWPIEFKQKNNEFIKKWIKDKKME